MPSSFGNTSPSLLSRGNLSLWLFEEGLGLPPQQELSSSACFRGCVGFLRLCSVKSCWLLHHRNFFPLFSRYGFPDEVFSSFFRLWSAWGSWIDVLSLPIDFSV